VKGRIYEALMGSNDRMKTRSMLKILMMVEVSGTSANSGVKRLVILTRRNNCFPLGIEDTPCRIERGPEHGGLAPRS